MEYITYVEIENFKGFKENVHIELKSPSVLIGPNNAGKTTVLQALSLWSRAVNTWYEKKGNSKKKIERFGVGINRLNIMDIPVKESRYYWNGTKIRSGNTPISFSISVGVLLDGAIRPLKMLFNSRDQESVYCRPENEEIDDALFDCARNIPFNLLYPMSGISANASHSTEEYRINEGQIRSLIGQGQTALVLRNLCYQVFAQKSKEYWNHICELIQRLFQCSLENPEFDENRGVLSLNYRQPGVEHPLDIALSGRGMQQILLILSYLYSHSGSVLMIDEPDAHLEILRQKQVFAILKDVAEKAACQIIIATHSEVILDEAVDINLNFLINGVASDLASTDIKTMLRNLGVEHYYQAKLQPRLLIVEGSTDVSMLRAFAKKLHHPAEAILDDRLFTCYTQDSTSEASLGKELSSNTLNFRTYFHTLEHLVPGFRGLAIFDSDGNKKIDEPNENLGVFYWKKYELENYFISPETLIAYIGSLSKEYFWSMGDCQWMEDAANDAIIELLLNGNQNELADFQNTPGNMKEKLFDGIKMSKFAENAFERFARLKNERAPLRKGEFYKIIDVLPEEKISPEILEKLDLIVKYLGDSKE